MKILIKEAIRSSVLLPLPYFFRPTELDRLHRAFRHRVNVYGGLDRPLQRMGGESMAQFTERFRHIGQKGATHYFTDFHLSDKGISGRLELTDLGKHLIDLNDTLMIVRRANNDYWYLEGNGQHAPGFFGFDLFTIKEGVTA